MPGLCPGAAGRRRVQSIFFLLYTRLVILRLPHASSFFSYRHCHLHLPVLIPQILLR